MKPQTITLLTLLILTILHCTSGQSCTRQRCCLASPCTQSYCSQKNTETWISQLNFANYQYTKLVLAQNMCLPCSFQCKICSSLSGCTTCYQSYFVAAPIPQCRLCPHGCKACSFLNDVYKCTSCIDGFYLDSLGKSCKQCPSGALTCSSLNVVVTCQIGTAKTSNSLYCTTCPNNCATCPSSSTTCTSCLSAYYLRNGQCQACSVANCALCAFTSNQQVCTSCLAGYFISSGTCRACSTQCLRCTSASVCLTCSSSAYLINSACQLLTTSISNCLVYQGASTCLQCQPNYYLQSSTQCRPCSMLCNKCNGPHFGACQQCNSGTALFNQMCLIQPFTSSSIYQNYIAFPWATNLLADNAATVACNFYAKGTTISVKLDYKAASKVTIRYRLYSVNAQTDYTVSITNDKDGLSPISYTSRTGATNYALCNNEAYFQQQTDSNLLFNKISQKNTLIFKSSSSSPLAVSELIATLTRCTDLCTVCSDIQCTECVSINLYTQDASCVYACSRGYYTYVDPTSPYKRCLKICPFGTFPDQVLAKCIQCTPPCRSCRSGDECATCLTGYFLTSDYKCIQECPVGSFGRQLTASCEKCRGRCKTCSSQIVCKTCADGFLVKATGICVDSCVGITSSSINLYADIKTLNCEPCSSNCLTCQAISTRCLTCPPSKFYLAYKCLDSCPIGYVSINSICNECSHPCEECITDTVKCTACVSGYLHSNTCLDDCPIGFTEDNTSLRCTACSIGCASCQGSPSYCLTCITNYFLAGATCSQQCPSLTYANPQTGACTPCVSPCANCITAILCKSCAEDFLSNGACIKAQRCPAGTYPDLIKLSCEPCQAPCVNCLYAARQCLSCAAPLALQVNSCVQSCSDQYYLQSTSMKCLRCQSPCLNCLDPQKCTSCQPGYLYSSNTCTKTCSAGTFFQNQSCRTCLSNCISCRAAEWCQICAQGYYLNRQTGPSPTNPTTNITIGIQCVATCPKGRYADPLVKACNNCIYPCITCTLETTCLTCQVGVLYNGRCLTSCAQGSFLDISTNTCLPCAGSCLTCTTIGSQCQSCKSNTYLMIKTFQCVSVCLGATFPDTSSLTCQPCRDKCSSCTDATHCNGCLQGYYLVEDEMVCSKYCPIGMYADSTTGKCLKCDALCISCLRKGSCIECTSPYLQLTNQLSVRQNSCLTKCPDRYYASGKVCAVCVHPCLNCMSASQCLSCQSGFIYHGPSKSCMESCPVKSYYQPLTANCQPCKSPCDACLSQKECLSCQKGTYLLGSSCLVSCPQKSYADPSGICNPCSSMCLTCSDRLSCLTCTIGFFFNGFCSDSCPSGTYAKSITTDSGGICQSCQSPCLQCQLNATRCTSCNSGLIPYIGQCLSSCPSQTFLYQGTCTTCQFPCVSCESPSTCRQCLGGYLLFLNLTCIPDTKICPNDFYKMDATACVPITWCPKDYFIDKEAKICAKQCPASKYVHPSLRQCRNNCMDGEYVGASMVCYSSATTPYKSLMTMSALAFIKSSEVYVEFLFNQTVTWLATDSYPYLLTSPYLRLLQSTSSKTLNYTLESAQVIRLPVSYLPTFIQATLPAHLVRSNSTSYNLQNSQITVRLPPFVVYSLEQRRAGAQMGQLTQGICWLLIVLSLLHLFSNKLASMYSAWDVMQLLYFVLFLDIQFPPNLNEMLLGFSNACFGFLGQPFAFSKLRNPSSQPFYAYSYDNCFLRGAGSSLLILFIVMAGYFLLKLIELLMRKVDSFRQLMRQLPTLRKYTYRGLRRYRWHHINDVFFLTFLNVSLFGVASIYSVRKNLTISLDIIAAFVFLLLYIGFVIFAGLKVYRHSTNIMRGKLVQNLRCFYRDIDRTSDLGLYLIIFKYGRKVVYAVSIAIFSEAPMYVLPLLTFSSGLMVLFLASHMPYKKTLSNAVAIATQAILCIVYGLIAAMNFRDDLTADKKQGLGWACCLLVIILLILLVLQVFCKSMFELEPQQRTGTMLLKSGQQLPENDKQLQNQMTDQELRRKAQQFFNFLFPRLRSDFGLGDDSEDQFYQYQDGDSQNSQNYQQNERDWEIESDRSDEFQHYEADSQTQGSQASKSVKDVQALPNYLIRCSKQVEPNTNSKS